MSTSQDRTRTTGNLQTAMPGGHGRTSPPKESGGQPACRPRTVRRIWPSHHHTRHDCRRQYRRHRHMSAIARADMIPTKSDAGQPTVTTSSTTRLSEPRVRQMRRSPIAIHHTTKPTTPSVAQPDMIRQYQNRAAQPLEPRLLHTILQDIWRVYQFACRCVAECLPMLW